jgi:transcriptional regulator with XRE-family HTH domain
MNQGKHNVADPDTMGGRMQRARVEMNMSQFDVALAADIGESTVAMIERRGSGNWTNIVKIARVLDVSLYYLLGEREGYGSFGE